MSQRSPFVLYTADDVPMAFPPDTSYDDIVLCAISLGDGAQVCRDVGLVSIQLGRVDNGKYVEGPA